MTITEGNSQVVVSLAAMTLETVGVYYYDFVVAPNATPDVQLIFKVTYKDLVSDANKFSIRTGYQSDSANELEAILAVLGTPSNVNLANDIRGVQTHLGQQDVAIAAVPDLTWDVDVNDHLDIDSTGRALSFASGGGQAITNESIAAAVLNEPVSAHTAGGSLGERVAALINRADGSTTKLDTILNDRITAARASKLDFLDAAISTRESEANAAGRASVEDSRFDIIEAYLTGIQNSVVAPPPELDEIVAKLSDVTYGLANLRIQIDAKATLEQVSDLDVLMTNIKAALLDSASGLASIKNETVNNSMLLGNGTYGLSALAALLGTKANATQLAALPSAAAIRDAVWAKALTDLGVAGSIGKRIADNLDVTVSSRAAGLVVTAVQTDLTNVLTLLQNATYGLAALKDKHDQTLTAEGTGLAATQNVDADLAQARSDILSAIATIVNGTPTIISALEAIKGSNWGAGDDLHSIKTAIGTGSATLAKQTEILAVLDGLKGAGFTAATDSLKAQAAQLAAVTLKVDQTKTSLEDKAATISAKIDTADSHVLSVDAKLQNATSGLPAIKAAILAGDSAIAGSIMSVANDLASAAQAIADLSAQLNTAQGEIQTDIAGQASGSISTQVQGIISLLTSGTFGLGALKSTIDAFRTAETTHNESLDIVLGSMGTSFSSITSTLTAMQGTGFGAGSSLRALADAVAAVANQFGDLATTTQANEIKAKLALIADGNTGTFDPAKDSLRAQAQSANLLEGFDVRGT